jgi:hypothetical protein
MTRSSCPSYVLAIVCVYHVYTRVLAEIDEKDFYAFLGGFTGFLEKIAANCSRPVHRGKAKPA